MVTSDTGIVIDNARVVTQERVLDGACIRIENGRIAEISTHINSNGHRRIDAMGMHVLPGFVDLHSDAIEKEIEPRPNAYFPINMALFELDKKLADLILVDMSSEVPRITKTLVSGGEVFSTWRS